MSHSWIRQSALNPQSTWLVRSDEPGLWIDWGQYIRRFRQVLAVIGWAVQFCPCCGPSCKAVLVEFRQP